MITAEQYFNVKIGSPAVTAQIEACAEVLLGRVNAVLAHAEAEWGYEPLNDNDTDSQISGSKGGSGDGGFRLPDSKTGAKLSAHKRGCGVDVYDPLEALDDNLTDDVLANFGLYREHPSSTPGWCHFQSVAPSSGNRTFRP
jgi:hypothetical protein